MILAGIRLVVIAYLAPAYALVWLMKLRGKRPRKPPWVTKS